MRGRLTADPTIASEAARTDWRGRLAPALPLFLIAAATFAASYVAFHLLLTGPGRLPLWTLLSATGAILSVGGTAVLVGGGDATEESPFYDRERFVLLPVEEYESLRSRPPAPEPAAVAEPPAALPRVPPGAAATPESWREEPEPAPSHLRDANELDRALQEVEDVLAQLIAEPARPSPAPAAGPRPPPAAVRPPTPPPVPAAKREVGTPVRETPRPRPTPLPEPGVCTSCGSRIPDLHGAKRCSACQEPLCLSCATRADYQGYPDLCPRCHGLLALSQEGEDLPPRR